MPNTSRRRDLRLIYSEGAVFSVMVGTGEAYVAAFVLALGMGEVTSGLVATVPLVAGGLIQLVSPLGIRAVGSRRTWSVLGASLQAAAFLPLVAGAWLGRIPAWVIFAAVTLYWGAGMAVGPAWNVWVEHLVPRRLHRNYFARRTGAAQLGLLIGLVLGGFILARAQAADRALIGFALLFGIAGATRGLSAWMLSRQSEPVLRLPRDRRRRTLVLLRRLPQGPGGQLVLYMLALTATVTVASPFFNAYMLSHLELSYVRYMVLLALSLAAKVVVLTVLGRVAHRFDLVTLLRIAWLGIAPVPALWLLSDAYAHLIFLQVLSGAAWAIHEYATFLLLFQTIRTADRTVILTAFNLGNAVATVAGSLGGAALFRLLGGGLPGFQVMFAVSTVLRCASVFYLMRIATHRHPALRPAFRLTALRPGVGAVLRPVLATVRRRRGSGRGRAGEE